MTINFNARKTATAGEGYAPRSGSSVHTPSTANEKQVALIVKLCGEKRVAIPNLEGVTISGASEIIGKLQALPNWREATAAQINKIQSRCKDMGLEVPDLTGLSITKAGRWIEYLEAKWKAEFAHRITGKQIEMIKKMSICPDIDTTELYEIPQELWDELDKAEEMLKNAMHLQNEEATNLADVAIKEIKTKIEEHAGNFVIENMNKEIASAFISKNQQPYYRWIATRASDGQRALIQELNTRMKNEPFTDEVLMQFSKEQADAFINQLQKEMADAGLSNFGDAAQTEMDIPMEWGGKGFSSDQRNDTGCIWGRDAWTQAICSLYALVGQQAEQDIIEATDQDTALRAIIEWLKAEGQGGAIIGCLSSIMTEEEYKGYMESEYTAPANANDIPW